MATHNFGPTWLALHILLGTRSRLGELRPVAGLILTGDFDLVSAQAFTIPAALTRCFVCRCQTSENPALKVKVEALESPGHPSDWTLL